VEVLGEGARVYRFEELIQDLKETEGVRQIWLTGSAAAGLTPVKDLDIRVVVEREKAREVYEQFPPWGFDVIYKGKILPLHLEIDTISPELAIRGVTRGGKKWRPVLLWKRRR